jgi:hypothetical protein
VVTDREAIEALLHHHRIADVFTIVPVEEVARAWVSYHTGSKGSGNPNYWAAQVADAENLDWPGDLIREFIAAVVEIAPDAALSAVGWGLLDKFLEFDGQSVDWMVEQAAASSRFREALGRLRGINLDETSDEAVERLERAAGVSLRRWRGSADDA